MLPVRNDFLGILTVRPKYVGEHERGHNFDICPHGGFLIWGYTGIYKDIVGISPQ